MSEEIDQLRRLATRRIAETSLRQVAKDIRMSPSGLQKFADGSDPYAKSIVKLRAWRARLAVASGTPVQSEDADSALQLLTTGLESEPRAQAILGALDLFGRAYGDEPPAWIPEVRKRWLSRSTGMETPR